jgi:hypothetical protein
MDSWKNKYTKKSSLWSGIFVGGYVIISSLNYLIGNILYGISELYSYKHQNSKEESYYENM